jgi:hypothetical protein
MMPRDPSTMRDPAEIRQWYRDNAGTCGHLYRFRRLVEPLTGASVEETVPCTLSLGHAGQHVGRVPIIELDGESGKWLIARYEEHRW